MALQTSYSLNPSVSYEGQIVKGLSVVARTNRSGAAMPLGRFVKSMDSNSTASELAIDILATGAVAADIAGVLAHSHAGTTLSASGPGFLEDKRSGNVVKEGVVWVWTEEAVGPADPLFVRIIDGGAGKAVGQVRKSADTATAIAFPNARFDSKASAGSLVKVSVVLP